MGLLSGSDDKIARLVITSHKKVDCTDDASSTFEVQVNPKDLSYSFGIRAPDGGAGSDSKDGAGRTMGTPGTSGPPVVFAGYNEMGLTLDFHADATGIVPVKKGMEKQFFIGGENSKDPTKPEPKVPSIREHLNLLQNTVYGFDPEIHGPPYLKLVWGNIFPSTTNNNDETKPAIFKAILEKCDVKLVLFSLQGEPVKAEIKLILKSIIAPEARPMGNSPDITHHIDINHGDKMTMHCLQIYGRYDSKICSAVAEYNNLIDWNLKPMSKMVFPSIHLLNQDYLDHYEEMEIKPVNEESEYEQMVELIGTKKTKQHYKTFPYQAGEA